MFLSLGLIVSKYFEPICSCVYGDYGKLIFDPLSVHILTFMGILSQSKKFNF